LRSAQRALSRPRPYLIFGRAMAEEDSNSSRYMAAKETEAGILSDTIPTNKLIERKDAPLALDIVEKPVEGGTRSGTAGEADLRIDSSEDVSIAGPLEISQPPRSLINETSTQSTGSVKCDGSRLVGIFDVSGSPHYLTVDVKPSCLPFECSNATLGYSEFAQLMGDCKWRGSVGRDDLQMNFAGDVSIVGQLVTPLSSVCVHGAGKWSTVEDNIHNLSASSAIGTQNDVRNVSEDRFSPYTEVRNVDVAKNAREQQLLESRLPILACVRTRLHRLSSSLRLL